MTDTTGTSAQVRSSNNNLIEESGGIKYQTGFGNCFESECLPGALPVGRNTPRLVPYNLYTEQLSGTAFTAPRAKNRRVWLYRIQPSVVVGRTKTFEEHSTTSTTSSTSSSTGENTKTRENLYFGGIPPSECRTEVNPLRWKPMPVTTSTDFVLGMKLMCAAGDPAAKHGLAIYMYGCKTSMKELSTHFYNADGDFLIVPQQGTLEVVTELGKFIVAPTEIIVVPRGIIFQVNLMMNYSDEEEAARGYVLEIFNGGFDLPELGPIGSNGLANARDFCYPTAWTVPSREAYRKPCSITCKMHSQLFYKTSDHSPFNVVAWHGDYLPFKYDLKRFCAVNSVSYDHLDPSIYTVLTCQSSEAGTAIADFVIFPPRIMATDPNTFRPPWFHRNTMSEFMGLIYGKYDAKEGFLPGGASLHNCMTPHGPDAATYEKAVADECEGPIKFDAGIAFMFETCLPLSVSPQALEDETWLDEDYMQCWEQLHDQFTGWQLLEETYTG